MSTFGPAGLTYVLYRNRALKGIDDVEAFHRGEMLIMVSFRECGTRNNVWVQQLFKDRFQPPDDDFDDMSKWESFYDAKKNIVDGAKSFYETRVSKEDLPEMEKTKIKPTPRL